MSLQQDFKDAMCAWASGVSVVCTRHEGLAYGVTVSSFSSLSFDPLMVLVCLANSNRLPSMVDASGVFSVSLLAAGQEEVSGYFASSGREPSESFVGVDTIEAAANVPIVAGAIGHVVCRLEVAHVVGDHTILCGRVVEASADPEVDPLLYFRRSYRALEPAGPQG